MRRSFCLFVERLDARRFLAAIGSTPIPAEPLSGSESMALETATQSPMDGRTVGASQAAFLVVAAVPSNDDMADAIVNGGHPQEHPEDWAGADLNNDGKIEGVTEMEVLQGLVYQVIDIAEAAGDVKQLQGGRKAWRDTDTGHVVIFDPNGPGTGFIPDNPVAYWNGLE